QDQVNRPAATDVRQVEGPYRRVRLNAWLGRNRSPILRQLGVQRNAAARAEIEPSRFLQRRKTGRAELTVAHPTDWASHKVDGKKSERNQTSEYYCERHPRYPFGTIPAPIDDRNRYKEKRPTTSHHRARPSRQMFA